MALVSYSLTFTGSQENPPQSTSAFGTGLVVFDTTTNTARYTWQISGIDFGSASGQTPATITTDDDAIGFHFHNDPRGENGPIVFDIPTQDTDDLQIANTGGNTWMISGAWEPSDPASTSIDNFAAALASGTIGADIPLYNNIHTGPAPGGLIRAQLVGFRPPPRRDFNGDGKSDVLWQNDNGTVHAWQLDGTSATAANDIGSADPTWHINGTGDFGGDGKSDVLWRNDDGTIFIWEMDGATPINSGPAGFVNDPTWHIRGTGDFNGDSKSDILWHNDNGAVFIWEMNGTSVAAARDVGPSDPDFQIRGTADFGGDGRSDILWQHNDGTVFIWQMSGGTLLTGGAAGVPEAGWHIRGTGDFGGDGKADILWQHDNGSVHLWEMNGSTVAAANNVGVNEAGWHIRDIGDFGGDGNADILWQHDSGLLHIWAMDGASVIGTGFPGSADSTWNVIPPDNTGATSDGASPQLSSTGFDDIVADPVGSVTTASSEAAGGSEFGIGGGPMWLGEPALLQPGV